MVDAAPREDLSASKASDARPVALDTGPTWNERAALAVFVLVLAVGGCVLVFDLGRHFWFHGDEWDFLVTRDGGSVDDLLRAHNEHLHALPMVVYRLLWQEFGLRSYLPYQIPVIALHLTAAALLRVVMRRCGVNPWIATAAAGSFVLFGSGEENIVWAFQMGFTGALVFGLSQLLLADHRGPFGRRDWIALGMGGLGLLCSGFTPITVAIVGAVVLVRRGWRPALFQTAPLAVLYGAWWVFIGPDRIRDPYQRATDVGEIVHFVKTGLVAAFEGLGGGRLVGVGLGLVLVVGLAVAWVPLPRRERLRQAVLPLSLLLGGLAFLVVSGYGRWWLGPDVGNSSRYVHLVAGFSLPALAVAVDALTRRWRVGIAVGAIVLVLGVPHNIAQFDASPLFNGAYFDSRRELVAALARSPYATQVPRSTRPDPLWSTFTVGWLLDALDEGKLPELEDPKAALDPSFRLRFGLGIIDAPVPRDSTCETIRQPVDVSMRLGDELGVKVGPWTRPKDAWFFKQAYTIQLLQEGTPVGAPLLVHPRNGGLLRAQLDHLDVRFALAPGTESLILCR